MPWLTLQATHLISRADKLIIAPAETTLAMQNMIANGSPATVPCQTANMTPDVSTTSDHASCRVGKWFSTTMAIKQVTTGVADLH